MNKLCILMLFCLLAPQYSCATESVSREIMEVRCGIFASYAELDKKIIKSHYGLAVALLSPEEILYHGGWAEGFLYAKANSMNSGMLKIHAKSIYTGGCLNLENLESR